MLASESAASTRARGPGRYRAGQFFAALHLAVGAILFLGWVDLAARGTHYSHGYAGRALAPTWLALVDGGGGLLPGVALLLAGLAASWKRPAGYWYLQWYLSLAVLGELGVLGSLVVPYGTRPGDGWRVAFAATRWIGALWIVAKGALALALLKYFSNRKGRFGVEEGWRWVDRLLPRWTRIA